MSDLSAFLSWILRRHESLGGLTEIRSLRHTGGHAVEVHSGYFTPVDHAELLRQLDPLQSGPRATIGRGEHPRDGEANFYFTLHAVDPTKIRGPRGRLIRSSTSSRDQDICAYTLFPVDVDPVRPSGVSATDEEKAAALYVADNVAAWLDARGVGTIRADSGNGYHILVPLVAQTGDAIRQASEFARDLLKLLSSLFSTPQAKVDTANHNPARIFKLYGTLAVKGTSTDERPHRRATVDLDVIPPDVDLFALLAEDVEAFRASERARGAKAAGGAGRASSSKAPPTPNLPSDKTPSAWRNWRSEALDALPLEAVYGEWLTNRRRPGGWIECRDPDSPTGDQTPSAGVADGSGPAERGTFHSFREEMSFSLFDFLIRRGRASSFADACALVAQLSGVAQPGRTSGAAKASALPASAPRDPAESSEDKGSEATEETADPSVSKQPTPPLRLTMALREVERIREAWTDSDALERSELLRRVLVRLVGVPALDLEPILMTLRTISGYPLGLLRRTLTELRREQRQEDARSLAPMSGLCIDYVMNLDTPTDLLEAHIKVLRKTLRFFNYEGNVAFLRKGRGPEQVGERNIVGRFSAFVTLRFVHSGEHGPEHLRFGLLPFEFARSFAYDERLAEGLPTLSYYSRAPVFTGDWTLLATPGYAELDGGIYYDGDATEPGEGTAHLDEVLNSFCWREDADRTNFLGMLLTAITLPQWGDGHPFMVVNGNKPGVGKTTLAAVLAIVLDGRPPATITFTVDELELEKRLATRVEAGDQVLIVDNVKSNKELSSQVLERSISDLRPSFRRLGGNTAIERPKNDLLFCLTMNRTQLGTDLRRRSLPVNLQVGEGPNPDATETPEAADPEPSASDSEKPAHGPSDDIQVQIIRRVIQLRHELHRELLGMVSRWLAAGRPPAPGAIKHSSSHAWAQAIHSILTFNGHANFLENLASSLREFDPDYEKMLEICEAHWGSRPLLAGEWADALQSNLLSDRLQDKQGRPRSPRAQSTVVGLLFSGQLGAIFEVSAGHFKLMRDFPSGRTHGPAYWFERQP